MTKMDLSCPLCTTQTVEFLHWPSVPVHQNLLMGSAADARDMPRGTLSLCVCPVCTFVFNPAFDLKLMNYGQDYDNCQTYSPAFASHVNRLGEELLSENEVRDRVIVEVGCGNGDFLRKLVAAPGSGNVGYGFDPSYVGPDTDLGGRLAFLRSVYDERAVGLAADVVICRHVIEHVPAPLELLRSIRLAVTRPTSRVFFETRCIDWVLRRQVVWDLFYEQCSLFSAGSLEFAFSIAGFEVICLKHVFGGQFLWVEARPVSVDAPASPRPGDTGTMADRFGRGCRDRIEFWKTKTATLRRSGRLAVWGAAAKGVMFCNSIDPDCNQLECVVDINPAKQGHFIAGTGHPIVNPDELATRGVTGVLVLNPNYADEIRSELERRAISAIVYDLLSQP